jgi:NAD(P)-dependent dehydrogenase (short-subunit alcohol dehydrogenase family)
MGRTAGSPRGHERLAMARSRTRAPARAARPVALVTGAANGIGRAIALHLLDAGWCVVAFDLPKTRLAQHYRGWARSAAIIEGDAADEDTVRDAVRLALDRFGRLDAVVANAGVLLRRPLRRLTLDDWNRVLDTNLTSTFLLAREARRALRTAKGSIVTIASNRTVMSEPNTESYVASKGGLVALTHALAISLAPHIRVNCVSPGWIATTDYNKLRRRDHLAHPAGRVGRPQDVAETVAFLLDREKSGFITGANLTVDGGMTRKLIMVE